MAYDYEFWQYSSAAKIDGYAGSLDANFWYKDTSEQTTGLKAADGASGTVNLSWDSVSADDVEGYQVWRSDSNGKIHVAEDNNRLQLYRHNGRRRKSLSV